jgi:hypothetical protein
VLRSAASRAGCEPVGSGVPDRRRLWTVARTLG